MYRKKLLKLAFLYLWICLERLCSVLAMAFTIASCIAYLIGFNAIVLVIQLCAAMLSVTSWKAADHDGIKLEKSIKAFELMLEDSDEESGNTLSEGGFRNEQAF